MKDLNLQPMDEESRLVRDLDLESMGGPGGPIYVRVGFDPQCLQKGAQWAVSSGWKVYSWIVAWFLHKCSLRGRHQMPTSVFVPILFLVGHHILPLYGDVAHGEEVALRRDGSF